MSHLREFQITYLGQVITGRQTDEPLLTAQDGQRVYMALSWRIKAERLECALEAERERAHQLYEENARLRQFASAACWAAIFELLVAVGLVLWVGR